MKIHNSDGFIVFTSTKLLPAVLGSDLYNLHNSNSVSLTFLNV